MTEKRTGGSRYLYEPFEVATTQTVKANERVQDERWKALEYRLSQIEAMLERLEKRLWLTIFGVSAAILGEVFANFLDQI